MHALLAALLALPCALVSGGIGAVAGEVIASGGLRRAPPPLREDEVAPHRAAVVGALERYGLVAAPALVRGVIAGATHAEPREWSVPLALDDGECLGLVVSATRPIEAAIRHDAQTWVRGGQDVVVALSHCRHGPGPLDLVVQFPDAQYYDIPVDVDVAVTTLRPAGDARFDIAALPRGRASPALVRWLREHERDVAIARDARYAADHPTPIFGPVELTAPRGALLLPDVQTLRHALATAAVVGSTLSPEEVTPRTFGDAEVPETDATTAALFVGEAAVYRVLAVIDAGNLPFIEGPDLPCVDISWSRLALASLDRANERLVPRSAADAYRVFRADAAGADVVPLSAREGPLEEGITVDRRCPSDGLVYYLTADYDDAPYRLRIEAAGEGGGPRRPTEIARAVPVHPALRRARAGCDELADPRVATDGDGATRCVDLARRERFGVHGPIDLTAARRAYERACAHGTGCVELAALLRAQDPGAARALLQRRCDEEAALECMALGDDYRLRARDQDDLRAAFDAYQRGCELGETGSCRNRDAMVTLQLVSPPPSE